MRKLLVCSLLVAGVSSVDTRCLAQERNREAAMPYYVTAEAGWGRYLMLYPNSENTVGTGPWKIAAGRRLGSRWATQLSYAYEHQFRRVDPSHVGTTDSGQPTYGWSTDESWTSAVTALMRCRLIQSRTGKLQLEVFGGGAWVSTRSKSAYEDYVAGQLTRRSDSQGRAKNKYVTAGLGVCYLFNRHLEGVFDYGYIRNLEPTSAYINLNTVGNDWGITHSRSLGLRYRFNLSKAKASE